MRLAGHGAALVTTGLVAVAALSGCSSDQPAVCTSVDSLEASVDNLKDVNLAENGLAELQSTLTRVKDDVQAVRADSRQQYGSEVDTVSTAVSELEQSLKAAKENPSPETLRPLASAVAAVGSGFTELDAAVSNTC